MTERRRGLFIGLALTAAVAGGYWLWQALPWKTVEIDRGYSDEARRNPFLAAELFLKQRQISVSSARGLSRLDKLPPAAGATLLLYSNEGVLSREQTERLWRWTQQGGHLIVNANTYTADSQINPNLLFQKLGLSLEPRGDDKTVDTDKPAVIVPDATKRRKDDCLDEDHVIDVNMDDEAEPLRVALHSDYILNNQGELAQTAVAGKHGIQLMRYFVGKGMITVASDLRFWSNRHIACNDHAYFLWKTVGGGEVMILSYTEAPSLINLLWRQTPLGLSLSLLLLIAWLWRRGRRFGPLRQHDHSRRRRLGEHLHASAMFAWRNKYIAASIDGLRQAIRSRMIARHPDYRQLTGAEQQALIARQTGLSVDMVSRILSQKNPDTPRQLTEIAQGLQQIRNRL